MDMKDTVIEGNEFLRDLFDSMPTICMVVDEDVRILFYNAAASKVLGVDKKLVYMKRGGEALHCISSTETTEGCGRAPACAECVVRNSVTKAIKAGKTTRAVTKMQLVHDGDMTEIHLMVSASPFRYIGQSLAVVFLEDISEIMQLRDMMPICSHCKKIRTDNKFWESLEEYLAERHDVYLSHGICPDCMKKLYPEYNVDVNDDTTMKHPQEGGDRSKQE